MRRILISPATLSHLTRHCAKLKSMHTSPAEIVLAVLPGESDTERVILVMCPERFAGVELRHQSYGRSVGWFTQSSVRLDPHQVTELRQSLGVAVGGGAMPSPVRRPTSGPGRFIPRVVHADSA